MIGVQMIEIELPIIVVSEANRRDHWRVRARRAANQKAMIAVNCRHIIKPLPDDASATITLTRLGKRNLDSDNLAGAFKAVRDAIAELLGVNDGSPRLNWLYGQEKYAPQRIAWVDDYPRYPPCLHGLQADGTGIRIKIEVYPCLESQAENAMEIFADMRQWGEG